MSKTIRKGIKPDFYARVRVYPNTKKITVRGGWCMLGGVTKLLLGKTLYRMYRISKVTDYNGWYWYMWLKYDYSVNLDTYRKSWNRIKCIQAYNNKFTRDSWAEYIFYILIKLYTSRLEL